MSEVGGIVLAAVLVLCAGAAWWLRARDGAVRTAARPEADRAVVQVLERLGARPAEAALTVVQFSTAFCGPCRATRVRLEHLQQHSPGLAVLHVDAEQHLDAVGDLDVRRTPSLFYLDSDGGLIGRSSGAPRPEELTALVAAHVGTVTEGTT
jgi:thiol-disulfide isomerase/thioredoxin